MTKYYLKMDNIMKNMFVVALNDELQAQSEQDECLEETKALLKKVSEYDLAQKRLQITAGEQRQIRKALNRLRSKYLAAGRYSDGIDKIIIQVAKPNTTRHMFWYRRSSDIERYVPTADVTAGRRGKRTGIIIRTFYQWKPEHLCTADQCE